MKSLIISLLCLTTNISFGQSDTIYLDSKFEEVNSIETASYFKLQSINEVDSNKTRERIYAKSDILIKESNFVRAPYQILDGFQKVWFESGQLKSSIEFKNGNIDGNVSTYWHSGKPKRDDNFKNGRLVDGKCFDSTGNIIKHFNYEIEAKYPKGEDGLMNYIDKEVDKLGDIPLEMEGRVDVSFIVENDGSLSDIKIIRGLGNKYDYEAIRIVKKMLNWKPAQQDGEPERSTFELPIIFMND